MRVSKSWDRAFSYFELFCVSGHDLNVEPKNGCCAKLWSLGTVTYSVYPPIPHSRITVQPPRVGYDDKHDMVTNDACCIRPIRPHRCFPEDLLFAVEALPATIESLERQPLSGAVEDSDGCDEENHVDSDDEAEDDTASLEEQEYHEQDLKEQEGVNDDGVDDGDGDDSDEASVSHNDRVAARGEVGKTATIDNDSEDDDDEDDDDEDDGDEFEMGQDLLGSQPQQASGRSRRRRLRRRRSESTSKRGPDFNVPGSSRGSGRGRRSSVVLPELITPFLTWLLWLEHCRRASEVERRSRSAARAFVARAGALGPVLEACCRVIRESQVSVCSCCWVGLGCGDLLVFKISPFGVFWLYFVGRVFGWWIDLGGNLVDPAVLEIVC